MIETLVLKGVHHVLDIRFKLESVGKLDDEGFFSFFRNDHWELRNGAMVTAKRSKRSDLYYI